MQCQCLDGLLGMKYPSWWLIHPSENMLCLGSGIPKKLQKRLNLYPPKKTYRSHLKMDGYGWNTILAGGFNPSEKYLSNWIISQVGVKIENIWIHHPVYSFLSGAFRPIFRGELLVFCQLKSCASPTRHCSAAVRTAAERTPTGRIPSWKEKRQIRFGFPPLRFDTTKIVDSGRPLP